ncbi:riboflavin biosynthesis protein [Bacillus sp. TS-2]|nr:riboflavin biosynthesis protein [Bacillus sp. TS-2]
METIYIKHPIDPERIKKAPSVMALGYFDGVHKGHQQVIKTAAKVAIEQKLPLAVMTFHPHPKEVLSTSTKPMRYITPLQEKMEQMKKLGVDQFYIISFTKEFASLSPQQFVKDYLISLNVQHVVAGFDFTYGAKGKGNMDTIEEDSKGHFNFSMVPALKNGPIKVSSTHIRELIHQGEVQLIPDDLGRYYKMSGTVIDGEKRGRKLGFPTANIQMNERYEIPKTGVYVVKLSIDGHHYFGVCNIGYKPTFHVKHEGDPSIEIHIFDFKQDIYGKEVEIEWLNRIREEKKFASIDDLIHQIHRDKEQSITYLKKNQLAF